MATQLDSQRVERTLARESRKLCEHRAQGTGRDNHLDRWHRVATVLALLRGAGLSSTASEWQSVLSLATCRVFSSPYRGRYEFLTVGRPRR